MEPSLDPTSPQAPRRTDAVLPVSLLVGSARMLLERHLGLVWIGGEISNFTRAASGHCYFNLKDAGAQARCVFFRHKAQHADFSLRDGLAVEVRATPSIYEPRGEFQLNVESIRLAGAGALYARFLQLKARLEAAGWFDDARKRPLPAFPSAVGVVTSTAAAALRDILTTARRRHPGVRIIIYPCAVQGSGAAKEIADAIRTANLRREVDLLIVGRGGGSIEDLWAFNEEEVAAAVRESFLPIVSAVGHETDYTICDFVADARAATPTAAVALAFPDRGAWVACLEALAARWRRATWSALERQMQRYDQLARRLVHPAARIEQQQKEVRLIADRLTRAMRQQLAQEATGPKQLRHRLLLLSGRPMPQTVQLEHLRQRWEHAHAFALDRMAQRITGAERSLFHLNPQAVLDRGYSIVTQECGGIVHASSQLAAGDAVHLRFAKGSATATIDVTGKQ